MEDKELLEMPIEIINPGNGLPDAPPCAPFSCPGVCKEPEYIPSFGICGPQYGCFGQYTGNVFDGAN